MKKKTCLILATALWAASLLFPVQTLQTAQWRIHGLQLPIYYFLIGLPVLLLIICTWRFYPAQTRWQRTWWLFPLIALPGILFGVDSIWAARQWLSFCIRGLGVAASLACLLQTAEDARFVLRWVYVAAATACLYGIAEVAFDANPLVDEFAFSNSMALPAITNPLFQTPGDRSGSIRPMGTQGNRIPYTVCLVPFIPIGLWKLRTAGKGWWIHAGVTAAMTALVVYSRVRSSWVGLACGLAFYLYQLHREKPAAVRRILILILCFLALGLAVRPVRTEILKGVRSFTPQDKDIQHRLGSLSTVKAVGKRWLFGVGYGNYSKVYKPYYTGPFGFLATPDNQYLRWLIETGVFGGLVLAMFTAGLFRAAFHAVRSQSPEQRDFFSALAAGWIALAVTFLFFDGFYWMGPQMTYWCWLSLFIPVLTTPTAESAETL